MPPPPQAAGDVQLPQLITPPQPSASGPHEFAGHAVMGAQFGGPPPPPHTFGWPPPPQICGLVHAPPQLIRPPHPSPTLPQFIPVGHDVLGVHPPGPPPQTPGTPPPPQIWGRVHVPQFVVTPPQPSGWGPQVPG